MEIAKDVVDPVHETESGYRKARAHGLKVAKEFVRGLADTVRGTAAVEPGALLDYVARQLESMR